MFSLHDSTGYWDPEFEPSVEEIVDYIDDIWRFSQFAFFSELVLWGDFPIQSSTWQVEITSGSTGSSHALQYTRIWSIRSLSMSTSSNDGGVQ